MDTIETIAAECFEELTDSNRQALAHAPRVLSEDFVGVVLGLQDPRVALVAGVLHERCRAWDRSSADTAERPTVRLPESRPRSGVYALEVTSPIPLGAVA